MAFLDLFRPAWKHSDPTRRQAAVEDLSDESVLARVATEDLDGT